MFDKYRSLTIAVVLISFFLYIGYRSEQNIQSKVHHVIEEEKKIVAQALGSKPQGLTEEDVKAVIKDYINNNPTIVSDALDKLQQIRMDDLKKKVKEQITIKKDELESPKSPYIGNLLGKSVVIMFFDYKCGYCQQSYETISMFAANNKDVKVILKPYPILGADAEFNARLALAVFLYEPSKFKDIHEALLSDKIYTKDDLAELFKEHELSYAKFDELTSSDKVTNMLNENKSLAQDLKINGVPSFIINGNFYAGFLSAEQIKDAINKVTINSEAHLDPEEKNSNDKMPFEKSLDAKNSDEKKIDEQKDDNSLSTEDTNLKDSNVKNTKETEEKTNKSEPSAESEKKEGHNHKDEGQDNQ